MSKRVVKMLDAQRTIDFDHALRCFCRVCSYQKPKCKTKWKCAAYKEFCQALTV
ncbi:MAG: hypothetical protein KBT34_08755 [Prevotella sp.]|nr:hypothetical protein [Candidatus Prevotella equi]